MDNNRDTSASAYLKRDASLGVASSVASTCAWQAGLTPHWPWWVNGLPLGATCLKLLFTKAPQLDKQASNLAADELLSAQAPKLIFSSQFKARQDLAKPLVTHHRDRRFDFIL